MFWSSIAPDLENAKLAVRVKEFNECLRYFALTNSNCHFLNSFHCINNLGASAFQKLSKDSAMSGQRLNRVGLDALHK